MKRIFTGPLFMYRIIAIFFGLLLVADSMCAAADSTIDSATGQLTLWMVLARYSGSIMVVIAIMVVVFAFCVIAFHQTKKLLYRQQQRYFKLAGLSNEYVFEYDVQRDRLILSNQCAKMFGLPRVIDNYRKIVQKKNSQKSTSPLMYIDNALRADRKDNRIDLFMSDGRLGKFRTMNTLCYDRHKTVEFIIGKFVDVSQEVEERKKLEIKAQMDGMTGVYNAKTCRKLMQEAMTMREQDHDDAFIILDIDYFKGINDTMGHHVGDKVLQTLARNLKRTVRSTDIIGRLGGDEFCIYMRSVPSRQFVGEFCEQINSCRGMLARIKNEQNIACEATVSLGAAFVKKDEIFEEVYKRADAALYKAKNKGRNTYALEDK
ncbi:MAG: GGDEF domain-containing protein [Selenomonadaceae bacterium]